MRSTIAVLLLVLFLNRCANQRTHYRHVETKAQPRTGVISRNETGVLVDTTWMLKYKLAEANHGTIAEDDQIKHEGSKFRVPQAVIDHFGDMSKAASP